MCSHRDHWSRTKSDSRAASSNFFFGTSLLIRRQRHLHIDEHERTSHGLSVALNGRIRGLLLVVKLLSHYCLLLMLLVHLLLLELLVLVLVLLLLLLLPHARVVHVQVGREVVDVDRTRVVAGQGG